MSLKIDYKFLQQFSAHVYGTLWMPLSVLKCIKAIQWYVTPKLVPPKIGPAGLILAKKFAIIGPYGPRLLPKSVQPDQF